MTYELLYILSPKLTEDDAKKNAAEIKKIIEEKASSIIREDFWGKKKLAYQIGKYINGYYALLEFESETSALKVLNVELKPREDIVRFLFTRIDEKLKAARVMAKKRAEEQERRSREEAVAPAFKPTEEKAVAPREEQSVPADAIDEKIQASEKEQEEQKIVKEVKEDKEKSKLDDLDKKIEEILDEDIK